MRLEETIEAPAMGQRITCLSSTVSTGGELLRLNFWMRGDASPPPLHVHPRQEERIEGPQRLGSLAERRRQACARPRRDDLHAAS